MFSLHYTLICWVSRSSLQSHSTDESPLSGDEAIVGSCIWHLLLWVCRIPSLCRYIVMHTLTWSSQQVVGAGLTFDLASCIYSIFDSCFRCFGVHTPLTAVKLSGLSWDKKWSSIWPFSKPTICLYSSFLVLDFYIWYSFPLHCSSSMHSSFSVHLWLCHSFLTHPFFFFLHFYPFLSTLIISHFSSCPILASCLRHIFPRFHTISHPFLPPQAVWDVSCVCRPAGPDPRMLQRERWKNPQLLQHSSPLPAVCQQQQTGVHLMN